MDYRCPVCSVNLARRRFSQAIVTRMEIECSNCRSRILLNVHRAESITVLASFAALVVLAALAYWLQNQMLMLLAFAAAMAGSLALPVIERNYLRTWPRYVAGDRGPGP